MKNFLYTTLIIAFLSNINNARAQVWSENFNSGIPSNWVRINNDGGLTPNSNLNPMMVSGLTNNAWIAWLRATGDSAVLTTSYFTSPATADRWLITPQFAVTSPNAVLTWEDYTPAYNYADNMEVWVSPTAGNFSASFTLIIYNQPGATDSFTKHLISLGSFNGQTIRIAFREHNTDKYLLYLDNPAVSIFPSLDAEASKVTFPHVVAGNSSNPVKVKVTNNGASNINSIQASYTIDGGIPVSQTFTGLSISPFSTNDLVFSIPIINTSLGSHTITFNILQVNGTIDNVTTNNQAITNFATALTVPRNGIMEEFSSSTSPGCSTNDAFFDPLILSNNANIQISKFNVVKYQMNWPSPGDASYNNDGLIRRNFYNINGTPDHYTNGIQGGAWNQVEIDNSKLTPAFVTLSGSYTVTGDSLIAIVNLTPNFTLSGVNYKLMLSATEKHYQNSGNTSGQLNYYHVMRKMLPDGNGIDINNFTQGVTQTFIQRFKYNVGNVTQMSNNFWSNPIQSNLIAFLQEVDSKEILQSISIPANACYAGTDTTICYGNSVQLGIDSVIGHYYKWSSNTSGFNSNLAKPFVSPTTTTTYYLEDSVINGLTLYDTIVVTVALSQQIIGNTSITPLQSNTYFVANTVGINYLWIAQNGLITSGQGTNIVNVSWLQNGPYLLKLIQTNCSDTTFLLVINSSCNSPINVNTIIPSQLCSGDTVMLVAQVSSSPTTYQWIKNGQILSSQTNDTLLVTSTGNYQVQVTSSGCTNISNNTPVSFLPSPSVPVITSLGNMGSCVAPSIVLKANGGPYQSYLWNTGISSDTMIATTSGNYNVMVTEANGCKAKSADFPVNISVLPVFPICLVTVDSATSYNLVVWEKPTLVGVDSFFIYREGSQLNVFNKIGAKWKSQFSTFTDSSSNVNQQSYKYKVAVLDTCGNITLMSDYHKTIHLTVNQGLGNVWNLIWNAYEGFNYSSYNIYRGNSTGNLQLLTTISSANNSYTDVNPPANVNYYLVEAISPNGCNPTAKTTTPNSTISNFVSIVSNNVNETNWNDEPIYVYPNPSNGIYHVVSKLVLNAEITDLIGREITTNKNVVNIDLSNQTSGVYFLKLSNEKGQLQKIVKLMKE